MTNVRDLLLSVDIELEAYHDILCRARNPALSDDERSHLMSQGESAWRRLNSAHRRLASSVGSDMNNMPVNRIHPWEAPKVNAPKARLDIC